jgi:excisionase family DNA binding protein
MQGKLVGYAEAALMLGVRVGTLYGLVHKKRVPHVRLGGRLVRFDHDALVAWLDARRVPERTSAPRGGVDDARR